MKRTLVTVAGGLSVLLVAAGCGSAPTDESDEFIVSAEQPLLSGGGLSAKCGQWPSCPPDLPNPPAGSTCKLVSEKCEGRNQTCSYKCTSTAMTLK